VKGEPGRYTVITNGEVFIPDLGASATLVASWPGGGCSVNVVLSASDDPQPYVDNLLCRKEHYASR